MDALTKLAEEAVANSGYTGEALNIFRDGWYAGYRKAQEQAVANLPDFEDFLEDRG